MINKGTDIDFKDLSFTTKSGFFQGHVKQVLKGISGEFRGCELTAIVGPSGSGKSSLLNILSGFTHQNVSGTIKINEEDKVADSFRHHSVYIMQEENLHTLLTVREAMEFSVKLKTGNQLSSKQRLKKINATLEKLNLRDHMDTLAGNLSGGQRKRLSIALELANDPLILFLDEPTTGLDSSSSTQCVNFLKKLASEGKTVICTIHTPSARIFELFDHLYALADGQCIYQGASSNLVHFLSEIDLICPETYNPADFLLEIATNDYGMLNHNLVSKIENGKNINYRRTPEAIVGIPILNLSTDNHHYTSFTHQFIQLLLRIFLILKRDKTFIVLRFAINFVVGVLVGLLYIGNGNDATQMFSVFKYIFVSIFFLMYTSYYSLQTKFSLDLPIVKREHFNRYYSTLSYYLALSSADIPFTVISTLIYICPSYILTNQPLDGTRVANFVMISLLTGFTSQGFGLLAGSIFELKGTLTFASVFLPLYAILTGVFIFVKDAPGSLHWMFEITFVKHGFDGASVAILGSNRTKFDCNVDYCHYRNPQKFLENIGMEENFNRSVYVLFVFLIIFRVSAYCIMNHRLKH